MEREPEPTAQDRQAQLDEEQEDEEMFQNFLSQNCTAAMLSSEQQVLKALNLPAAPEGYKYDMTKSHPELVQKKSKSTKPKGKPSLQE